MRIREIARRLPGGSAKGLRPLVLLALTAVWAGSGKAAEDPIVAAARNADAIVARGLIEQGVDVNAAGADGTTPLLWATYHGDAGLVEALLAAGADADAANDYGVTPLLQASRTGDARVIAALLDAGADVGLGHPDGETPLRAAALTGRADAVRLLLEHGADPNSADSFQQQTALMWAAAEGHLDVVEALLAAGADPDRQARITALSERKNADYPSGGLTALMWAVRNGHEDVVLRLAAAGADLDIRNGDGATATMVAIVNDRFDLAAKLVELGAAVDDGSLYYAVEMRDATTDWYARDGSRLRPNHSNEHTALDLIALLLESGADPNAAFVGQMHNATMCCDTSANASPFYRAAVAADVEALELLIAHGADLEWTPAKGEGSGPGANANVGRAPLIAAMRGGRGVPLSAGPGYSREGPPPFREPSDREPVSAVRLLLEAGADPDATTPDGKTALHHAVELRDLGLLRAMTEGGATLDKPNKDGLTALQVAEELGPEPERNPFGPAPISGGAAGEELAAVLREAMQLAGLDIAPAAPSQARLDSDGGSD